MTKNANFLSISLLHTYTSKQSAINSPENMGERIPHFECTGSVDHHPIKTARACASYSYNKTYNGFTPKFEKKIQTDQKPII